MYYIDINFNRKIKQLKLNKMNKLNLQKNPKKIKMKENHVNK